MDGDGDAVRASAPPHDADGTARLFPSLGFFGGTAADALVIDLDEPVSRVLLRVPDDASGGLDLGAIRMTRGGNAVPLRPRARSVRQSGYVDGDGTSPDVSALEHIQTPADPDSWWMVRFHAPVEADRLRVLNRSDRFGFRTRRLEVRVAGERQPWRTAATAGGPEDVARLVPLLESLTGLTVRPDQDAESVAQLRVDLMRALAERSLVEPLSDRLDDVRRLLALVPTGRRRDRPTLSGDERTVLAHLLAAQFAYFERTPTSLASFGFALGSRAELELLRLALERVAPTFDLPPLTITRHGLRVASGLRALGEEYVALIIRAAADFDALGHPLMLGYGTLLGAVREGDFLAHDDDIDLLYPVEAPDAEAGRTQIDDLCRRLRGIGWKIWRNTDAQALNFHLIDRASGLRLDVFPALVDGDASVLHMEKMALREVPTSLLLPVGARRFRGQDVGVPHDPEGFLAERYGPTWDVADPYDDWRWPLDEAGMPASSRA